MSYFTNKTAIITGSSKGIGKAIARELCCQGANVVLNGLNEHQLEATRKAFEMEGLSVAAVRADVTIPEDCARLVGETIDRFGKVDIVVANSGLGMNARFENMGPEVFARIITSNVYGPASSLMQTLPYLRQSKGSFIFISSVAGLIGVPTASAYSAGKMALTGLAQSLKMELADTGVHIGIVYVGFTQNEPGKQLLNAKGEMVPVAARPARLQQTRRQVARAVLKAIKRRRFKTVLTFLGKFTDLFSRLFPGLALRIALMAQRSAKCMTDQW